MNKQLIIVFANENYLDVLRNWLTAIRRLGITNFMVIALDEKLARRLERDFTPVLYRPCAADLGDLWVHRIKVLKELLDAGHDVIHSDADAVWLKNPLHYFSSIQQDMMFSQGTVWPPDVHAEWGFVLCCGLFGIRSNARTRRFAARLAERVRHDRDDQVSCNRLLLESGMKWTSPSAHYQLTYRDQVFACYDSIVTGTCEELTVALLPHALVQRVPESSKQPYVKHVVSEKSGEACRDVLLRNACWFI